MGNQDDANFFERIMHILRRWIELNKKCHFKIKKDNWVHNILASSFASIWERKTNYF